MAFYDNFGKRIQQTGQGAIEKTKKTAETVKINAAVSEQEKKIQSIYTNIGKAYFEKYADHPEDEDFLPYFQEIEGCTEKIREYQDQLAELKGLTKCKHCGMNISVNAAFCNYCGTRIIPEASAAHSGKTCPNCGQAVKEDQLFCNMCGQRLDIVEESPRRVCSGCGAELAEGAMFCTNCGRKAEAAMAEPEPPKAICPGCGAELEERAMFCTNCGRKAEAAMAKPEPPKAICPGCGAELEEGAMFCTNCGRKTEPETMKPEFTESNFTEPVSESESGVDEPEIIVAEITEQELAEAESDMWKTSITEPENAVPDAMDPQNMESENSPAVCSSCGAELEPDAVFCFNCGKRVDS
ncbi:MAG: zinc ribbon domain-containing protein [Clostridiales bacterium]|nr:zinc ribbon domain-containing protein [Clostridiales bacterium]